MKEDSETDGARAKEKHHPDPRSSRHSSDSPSRATRRKSFELDHAHVCHHFTTVVSARTLGSTQRKTRSPTVLARTTTKARSSASAEATG